MIVNKIQRAALRENITRWRKAPRRMPWREPEADGKLDPYKILVSELMLQQTRVGRVATKFEVFLRRFPNVTELARAPLSDVLKLWSGLGYNRRAKYLHEAAKRLKDHQHPWTKQQLTDCKGIGENTAKAIRVYAYNAPEVFIETNIRSVFIHHFFKEQDDIGDESVKRLLAEVLDRKDPRSFYWALMDYGTHIKSTFGNNIGRSKTHKKQSPFKGSRRQIRGLVLRSLGKSPKTRNGLAREAADDRTKGVIDDLLREGLICRYGRKLKLAK
ncbi:MAG: A/G-specific adenine glycosylase [Candidatus Saccharibacteria bacterium]|nr:A/G-specific adenine glycosylase [Candidatus Saccharibacteria bacterium]